MFFLEINKTMIDLCISNPLECQNNSTCVFNMALNKSYCQCTECYHGELCENITFLASNFDIKYVFVIIHVVGLVISIINNGLIFELLICCKRIRHTNCGIYLFCYSICSLVSQTLLAISQIVPYYSNSLEFNGRQREILDCVVYKVGYNMFVYICIWFNAIIAFERGLIICSNGRMNNNRWRPFITVLIVSLIAGGSVTPLIWYNCQWNNSVPFLRTYRIFVIWFYIVVGLTIYVLATLLLLISFERRIGRYGMENGSCIKTYCKLLKTHLFIFIPPIVYIIGYVPYSIVINTGEGGKWYYYCGISNAEFITRILIETLTFVPVIITWLLFVYPSKVYMTEFYLKTWSGQWVAAIYFIFVK